MKHWRLKSNIFCSNDNPGLSLDLDLFYSKVKFCNFKRLLHLNMVRYNTVLDITRISVGPQLVILDLFPYKTIHFTLVIHVTLFRKLIRKLAWPQFLGTGRIKCSKALLIINKVFKQLFCSFTFSSSFPTRNVTSQSILCVHMYLFVSAKVLLDCQSTMSIGSISAILLQNINDFNIYISIKQLFVVRFNEKQIST